MTAAPLTLAPRPDVDHRGFVLVLAGGGYAHRAEHESVDVVAWLSSHGVASGYLDYAIAPERYPTALDQVFTALAELRAGVHGEITGPVAVLGFSAGGHLAGTVLTATDDDVARPVPAERGSHPSDAGAPRSRTRRTYSSHSESCQGWIHEPFTP